MGLFSKAQGGAHQWRCGVDRRLERMVVGPVADPGDGPVVRGQRGRPATVP